MKEKRVLNEIGRAFYKSMLFAAIFQYIAYVFAAVSLGLRYGFFITHLNTVATVCLGIYGVFVIWFTIHVIKKLRVR